MTDESGDRRSTRDVIAKQVQESGAGRGSLVVRPVKSAYEQVADQLRNLIISGGLAPGDRLPSESELLAMFSVSRSTVREALRTLSSQDLIVTTRGVTGGSFVAWPSVGKVSEDLEAKIGLLAGVNQVSVDDLLQARALLEVPAAELAATRRTDEQLRDLEASVGRSRNITREEHMQFHHAVLQAANNPLLSVMTMPVFRVLQLRFLRDAAPRSFWQQVEKDHIDLADAIAEGAAESASQLMADHLERLRETYMEIAR